MATRTLVPRDRERLSPTLAQPAAPELAQGAKAGPAARLVSLDVFRGLTVAGMVIVNNPGDWGNVYWPLLHADWFGWTPTDLIFPFFLFIVGISITLSRKSQNWPAILRRAAIIFALGLFLAGFPRFDVTRWRIPGVLPRIAVCYFFAAAAFRTVTGDWRRRAITFTALASALCVLYWFVMVQLPNPAGVRGDLTPSGNWGAFIDRAVFGPHLWVTSKTWDPEGLLSTIPAIATTLLGIVAGLWLGTVAPPERKAAGLLGAGIVAMAVGYAATPFFPMGKNLWTSSYVFFTAGAASAILAACFWMIDIRGWRGWTHPFVVLGANAITLFVASGLLVKTMALIKIDDSGQNVSLARYVFVHGFAPLASPKNASLLYAVANLLILYALLAWMYRRRLFLRV
jgi:predicted acyltransferase